MTGYSRRAFNRTLLAAAGAIGAPLGANAASNKSEATTEIYKIAATTWSFHRQLFGGELKATDMPKLVTSLGLDALEWTAKTFRPLAGDRELMFKAPPATFFRELRQASDDAGVTTHVVGVGGPFYVAGADPATRQKALDFCLQYVEPAQILGSKILRVELYSDLPRAPDRERKAKDLAMAGLNALLERTAGSKLIINVENHHGVSSEPEWLAGLVRAMNSPRLGLTADTNNFRVDQDLPYAADRNALPRYVDRYRGLEILMPLANWVSAKTYAFDSTGHEISLDYPRIIQIIRSSGYIGYLSVEYEGNENPVEGVRKSVEMLQRLRRHFS